MAIATLRLTLVLCVHYSAMPHRQSELEATLLEALEPHRPQLESIPHVVGTGLGFEEKDAETQRRYIVKVWVDSLQNVTAFRLRELIPDTISLRLKDGRELNIRTSIEEVGKLHLDVS